MFRAGAQTDTTYWRMLSERLSFSFGNKGKVELRIGQILDPAKIEFDIGAFSIYIYPQIKK